MQFTAIGFAAIPDTDSARDALGLHDLNEADIAKVMFHRHKQAHGDERLGWDQLCLGAVSLLRVDAEGVRLETFSQAEFPEILLIDAVFQAMQATPPLYSWGGGDDFVPLLLFRCLRHRRSAADYYAAAARGEAPHQDLRHRMLSNATSFPSLHDVARRLGLPGMQGLEAESLWEQWLAGERAALGDYAEVQALNTALLALEILHLRGDCALEDVSRTHEQLRAALQGHPRREALLGSLPA